MSDEHASLRKRIATTAGKTDQWAIREVAQAAASPPTKALEKPLNNALIETAKAFTALLSQTFQAVAWNAQTLYDEAGFERIYARVTELTNGFRQTDAGSVAEILRIFPPSLLVFRLIAALTLDEISALLRTGQGIEVSKDLMRDLELAREVANTQKDKWEKNCDALATVFVDSVGGTLLRLPASVDKSQFRDRKDKPDTTRGWESVKEFANKGVDYWILLYQRYVGGFFRQAMDASSSIKGDILEGALVSLLTNARIPFYRTRIREKLSG